MKVLALIPIAFVMGIGVLQPTGRPEETAEQNKAAVRYVFERAWNEAHFDSLAAVWGPAVPFHFRGRASAVGPDEVRGQIVRWRRAFPDFRFTIQDMIAEGDRVAVRLTFTGTHQARFMGVDSTGRQITVTEMMFFRLASGRVVEAWEDYDEHGLRQQLAGQ